MPTLSFHSFRLDPADHRLWSGSTPVGLRPKTFAVLRYLVERPGKLVRNDELLDAVWEGSAVTPGTLNTSIRELRKALGDDARQPRYIETVHRRGFRFVAPVRSDAESPTVEEGGGDAARAVEHLARAAASAGRRRQPREAAGYARRAIELLAVTAGGGRRDPQELQLRLELGRSLAALALPSSDPDALLDRSLELCRKLGPVRPGTRTDGSEIEHPEGAVSAAVDRLPDQQKEAVRLHYLSGLSRLEIARVTATPPETVASRILGALFRLGDDLASPPESRK